MNSSSFYLATGISSFIYTIYAAAKYYAVSGVNLITSNKAKKMIQNNSIKTIIDVRTKTEYELGHYPYSMHIPVTSFDKAKFKNMNKNNGILVYCNTGQRARRAAELLTSYGFKKVFYIEGTYKSLK